MRGSTETEMHLPREMHWPQAPRSKTWAASSRLGFINNEEFATTRGHYHSFIVYMLMIWMYVCMHVYSTQHTHTHTLLTL